MSLKKNQIAPPFTSQDIYGNEVNIPSADKKILLHFLRNAACPVCNFRVHELKKNAEALAEAGIEVVLIYESSIEYIQQYAEEEIFPFTFIADPQADLYRLYRVEKSWFKLLLSHFKGVGTKSKQGRALFKKFVKQGQASPTRIPAEFLVDKQGKLIEVHYGRYLGDDVKLSDYMNTPMSIHGQAPS